jgi:hypothetical protein
MKTIGHGEHKEHKLHILHDLRGVFLKSWATAFKLTPLSDCPGYVSRLPVFLDIMYPEYPHTCHNA